MKVLTTLDWVMVAAYFLLVFIVAMAVSGKKSTRESAEGYFLSNRNAGWFIVGSSLFASNIGAEHLVGLAGSGAAGGVAVGQFEILASLILLLLGWFFVPFYLKSGVFTMPEFLERRYSPAARWYLAVISIVGYVLTKISVTIFAGGIVFEALMGLNFWTGAVIVVVATGIYTVFGGLRAVLYTDMLQAFVFVGGSAVVLFVGLDAVGGWSGLYAGAGSTFFDMWKPVTDPSFPWTGILLGAPILGVWYWCTDQFIVQRVLAAKNVDNARRGAIFGGFLKVLPLFIFVIPGVIAHVLASRGQLALASPDQALPALIGALLPAGLRGLVVAGLLAALMSSLSSVFNSCSTLVTWDIYRKLRPQASEKRLVLVGQLVTVVMVGFGLAWIPMMKLDLGPAVPVPAERAGLHFAADRRGVPRRPLLAARQCRRRDGLARDRLRARPCAPRARTQPREPRRRPARLVLRRQLPALRHPAVRGLQRRAGAGEPRDAAALGGADRGPHAADAREDARSGFPPCRATPPGGAPTSGSACCSPPRSR